MEIQLEAYILYVLHGLHRQLLGCSYLNFKRIDDVNFFSLWDPDFNGISLSFDMTLEPW